MGIMSKILRAILVASTLIFPGPLPAAETSNYINPDELVYRPLSFQPPQGERITLDNGITLHIMEDRELPLIRISMAVRTGSAYDPAGKEGLAELTADVMRTGGAGAMSGNAIDEALEFIAAAIEPATSMEHTTWSLNVMKKDLDRGLHLFSQILKEPAFDDSKLKLAKDLKLEDLRRVYDDPQRLAFREFNRILYRGDPRGRLPSRSSISGLTGHDLKRFHRESYFPQNAMIAISGDISRAEAIQKIREYFGQWDKEGRVRPLSRPVYVPSQRVHYLIKDTPQSIVIAAQFAPSKKDRDYYAFEVLDFMIGSGGFRSRIFQEIRTNRGLAYSTGSFYRARTDHGTFGTYALTKTDSAPTVLSLIKSIVKETMHAVPERKELEIAKKSIINSFIFQYQSAGQIVHQRMMLEFNGLPADFLTKYGSRIDRLTGDDLKRAASGHLHPDEMTVLVLGTAEGYHRFKSSDENVEKIAITYD
jgi:predicted Zn-dependent peptidase